jgi:hypothetical protein
MTAGRVALDDCADLRIDAISEIGYMKPERLFVQALIARSA